VKYVALLQAGLSHDDVKIVILRNLLPKEDHAVVAARVDGQWLILDNRRLALRPVYSHRQARKSATRLRNPAKQVSVFS
jgi:predicted transglutaminase-like cysteine proteinase